MGVLLRADLTGHGQFSQFLPKRVGWLVSPQKDACAGFQPFFSIMFYYIFSTTYQKIGDLFCPIIFLDFRTVCPDVSKSSLGLNIETKKSNGIGLNLAQT